MIDIAVIGGGPAGLTAALYAARAGFSVSVFEREVPGGQVATTQWLENVPGFPTGIGGPEFAMALEAEAKNAGAKVRYESVKSLELVGATKTIYMRKHTETARAVILCMGAMPRKLGVPGEDLFRGRGVSYCATCDAAFYAGKSVAVVGGGDTAISDALVLSRLCSSVTLIHRRDTFRAQQALVERTKENERITVLWNQTIGAIEGDQTVQRVQLQHAVDKSESTVDVDAVFVAVGMLPNTELVQGQLGLDEGGYISADETCRTEIEGVFAAGDLRAKPLRQIVTATADGAVAVSMADRYITLGRG